MCIRDRLSNEAHQYTSPATSVITLEVGSPRVLRDSMAKSKEAVWPLCKLML